MHQKVYVRWSGAKSVSFDVNNGVRQGDVASPIFFNAYLDELFTILKKSGLGCIINGLYYGLFGYADDCSLLAPSWEALQQMLNICQHYFEYTAQAERRAPQYGHCGYLLVFGDILLV